jgi:phospholipase C
MGEGPTIGSRRKRLRPMIAAAAAVALAAGVAIGATAASASSAPNFAGYHTPALASATYYRDTNRTATPIKHLVVIFDENESFDHYFGTYPYAANTDGTPFYAKRGTPRVNGLYAKITKNGPVGPLLTNNPNEYNPVRLTHAQALTCDQNHDYLPEQQAENNGKMNEFVQFTENSDCDTTGEYYGPPGIVMNYYDGNTVTALWSYAQNYAMSDNNWDTTFGPSTEGAISVSSGQSSDAHAVTPSGAPTTDAGAITPDGTLYGDIDPYYDECSDSNHTSTNPLAVMTGENIGDLLNARHVTWGWFQGGFTPTSTDSGGAVCAAESENIAGSALREYTPHWEPFQFNATTANPAHLPPSSEAAIGRTDQANHQYDVSDFFQTLKDGNMPSVSYLKATTAQSGHPGESDPLDEQQWIVNTVNQIEQSKYWPSTAIVITYDDSDGWYDHVAPQSAGALINGSDNSTIDTAMCEETAITIGTTNGRCGYSQRLPMIVISPWTRDNYVSSNLTNTTSVVKFIENNWLYRQRIPGSFDATSGSLDAPGGLLDFNVRPHFQPLILDPTTGAVVSGGGWG